FGIAPSTASAFLNQRVRWGQGAMQVIRRDWMFLRPRLTLPQRLNYIASSMTYFDGWQKLVFYLAPVWVLLSGTMPLLANATTFLLLFVPFFVLNFIVFEEVGRGYGRSSTIEQYNMARFAAFAWSTIGLVRRRLPFRVTNKAGKSHAPSEARWMSPQILIGLLNVAAVVGGVLLWRSRHHLPVDGLIANLIWASVNIVMASLVVRFTMLRSRFRRREYRFPLPLPATLTLDGQAMLAVVDDISPAGCRVYGRFPPALCRDQQVTGMLHLPNVEVPFLATVAALIPGENGTESYTKALGLAFEWTDIAARTELETFLFGSDLQWQLHGFEERNRTPSEAGRELFSKRRSGGGQYGEDGQLNWSVAMVEDGGPVLLSCPLDKASIRVVASQQPPTPGHVLMLRTHTRSGIGTRRVRAGRLAATLSTPTGPLFITEVEPC
ncbi:MAG TPA: PilZ domain-containing protein, partial [Lysobacter sp.]|nr:PilZ domain-containing protein [Lysobacter sp.]